MFKVTFGAGETVLEQDSLPTDDDCLYMLDTGEVDIVIAGSGEAANTNQEERKVLCFACFACFWFVLMMRFKLTLFYSQHGVLSAIRVPETIRRFTVLSRCQDFLVPFVVLLPASCCWHQPV